LKNLQAGKVRDPATCGHGVFSNRRMLVTFNFDGLNGSGDGSNQLVSVEF
jgi:hypothetical protein